MNAAAVRRVGRCLAGAVVVVALAGCSSSGSSHSSSTTTPTGAPKKRIVPDITLLTAKSGGGIRPILSWQPVAGAQKYRVVVLDANTHIYWAWEGTSPSVPMGGGPKPAPKGSDGPRIAAGFSWSVVALGAHDKPLALSDREQIAP